MGVFRGQGRGVDRAHGNYLLTLAIFFTWTGKPSPRFWFSGLACEALTAASFGTIPAVNAPEAGPLMLRRIDHGLP
jgi:hypothetical protein